MEPGVTTQDLGNAFAWSSKAYLHDDLGRVYEKTTTLDTAQTWRTVWDLDDTQAWSREVTTQDLGNAFAWSSRAYMHDDLGRVYEETTTLDTAQTWRTVWDLDDTQAWSREVTTQDLGNAFAWSTQTYLLDDLDRLQEKTVVLDSAQTWRTVWDLDDAQAWNKEVVTEDLDNTFAWSTQTYLLDDLGRVYEKLNVLDTGQTWRTVWDLDDTQAWSREVSTQDVTNIFAWSTQENLVDELERLYEQTGTYDDGRTWQSVWDHDNSEAWHKQTRLFDTADNHSWSELIYEYDESNVLLSQVVIDDPIV
ncbi:hypothetical protein FGB62_678g00 [Gracilaria domingensis]|nr:hypothetical protein FGB62_678g00 [Gracilaria domingensis]